jgi:DNA-binding transcriptional MocR family regulator
MRIVLFGSGTLSEWRPTLKGAKGPLYLAIVAAMERDVMGGTLTTGARLLPQREMAEQLDVSIGTVTRAYSEAERRGLISGEVGRGTFVKGRGREEPGPSVVASGTVNLALNIPPTTGEDKVLSAQLAEVAQWTNFRSLLGYLPHQGLSYHRAAVARWLCTLAMPVDADALVITPGAQHALDIACRLVVNPGDMVLTEALTFSGMVSLAAHAGYRLEGVACDEEGLVPSALDAAFARTGARALYATPTLQSPTGTIMSYGRREAIAEILRQRDAFLIEDDAYAFLPEQPVAPIAILAPERVFHIISFAKCLAPGLRIGALVPPGQFMNRAIAAMRSTGWMAAPIMSELVTRLIDSGEMTRQATLKRARTAQRDEMARQILGDIVAPRGASPGFHIWIPLPPDCSLASLMTQAMARGITLAPPPAPAGPSIAPQGVRLCLGVDVSDDELARALTIVRNLLTGIEITSYV